MEGPIAYSVDMRKKYIYHAKKKRERKVGCYYENVVGFWGGKGVEVLFSNGGG